MSARILPPDGRARDRRCRSRSTPRWLPLLLLALLPAAPGPAATHPLDALDADEITAVAALLRASGRADERTLFASITLHEPPKADVLAWTSGDPLPRAALAVLRRDAKTYEAVVDLGRREIVSWEEIPGAQPFLTMPEILDAIGVTLGDARMREALARRGIVDLEKIFCAPRTVGNFGRPEEATRRLTKVDCFDIRDVRTDVFANPIENLFATVDLDRREVLAVTDLGAVPVPSGGSELDPASVGAQRAVRPVLQTLPEGGNLAFEDGLVRWQNWTFHVRWDVRAGLVLSRVSYDDGGRSRPVLYQGSLAEIYVPYQDPTAGWSFRTYMDEGDFGFGAMGSPLLAGADCPATAVFLPAVMANAAGGVDTLERRACIFERSPAEPVWRHYDFVTQALESRPAIELVVRYVATVGNYDYLLDWVLDQKGNLTYRGGATGVDAVKGVAARSLADASAAADTAWGPLISPGRAGIHHDHFFSLRLDLDVDGTSNSLMVARLEPRRLPAESARRSIWTVRHETLRTESAAKLRLSYERPAMWHVVNPHRENALGYPVSYMLHPEGNALPLVDADDPALARAQFALHHLWVTPYVPRERYAAGEYPNQSAPGQGLPAWTARDRDVEDTDIVLWYTMGFHHVPSAEDWPVYNLGWHALTLKPYNFFDRNPALDVPPAPPPAAP